MLAIHQAFAAEDITIALPQVEVWPGGAGRPRACAVTDLGQLAFLAAMSGTWLAGVCHAKAPRWNRGNARSER